MQQVTGRSYQNAIVDRGYRGINQVGTTTVIRPESRRRVSRGKRARLRKKCRSRSAIEPIIGHLKYDYRMLRNYLKGTVGDVFNATMAAAAFNFKRYMRILSRTSAAFGSSFVLVMSWLLYAHWMRNASSRLLQGR